MRLDVQNISLSKIIEAAIDTAKPAAEARRIKLNTIVDPSIIVSGDSTRLQQVFGIY